MYVESMGRTLLNLFKSYYTQLAKLDTVITTKNDLIAVEEAALKSIFTQKVATVCWRLVSISLFKHCSIDNSPPRIAVAGGLHQEERFLRTRRAR